MQEMAREKPMKKIHICLDTSVIRFLFADDAPEKWDGTIQLLDNYAKTGVYAVFVSTVVLDEIARTENKRELRKAMFELGWRPD